MDEKLKQKLIELADCYENTDFLEKDPSQFMHRYSEVRDMETAAFIAANLAFGRRDQILKHVDFVLSQAGKSPAQWILSGSYEKIFDTSASSFYRMYTYNSMRLFCDGLKKMLETSEKEGDGTLGFTVRREYERQLADSKEKLYLHQTVASFFSVDCNVVSHGKDSASKKLNMLLRWLVRSNSPVDLGLWDWYPKTELLMPLDTHVIQEATNFGIFPLSSSGKPAGATLKTAVSLTEVMKEAFPSDPLKGDFALFGLGVDEK